MKLVQQIKQHPWLFAGLAGVPFSLHSAFVGLFFACAPYDSGMAAIPHHAWTAAFTCLPILSGAIGMIVALLLSLVLEPRKPGEKRRLKEMYAACFTMTWMFVFGYLNFFSFVMGLGDEPAPSSTQQLLNRLVMVIVQFPITVAISLAVCGVMTAIVILICEIGRRITQTSSLGVRSPF